MTRAEELLEAIVTYYTDNPNASGKVFGDENGFKFSTQKPREHTPPTTAGVTITEAAEDLSVCGSACLLIESGSRQYTVEVTWA